MKDAYEAYGALARGSSPALVKAGRRMIQADAEKFIAEDVIAKLSIDPQHTFLEIGCGPGAVLEPISRRTAHATGIDHPDMIALARERCGPQVTLIAGQFPDVDIAGSGRFDRIAAYSVLHYMSDMPAAERFIDAALAHLSPSGKLLLGDLPNADMMARFNATEFGKKFQEEWRVRVAPEKVDDPHIVFKGISAIGTFNDAQILGILARYRSKGYHAYLLPQRPELPTGYTREDILITLP